jgi:flagellar hook-associated protein 2
MGSPITFSGFNNIDFGSVLNAIMAQERQPIATIEAQQKTLQAQNSAFATLATKLAALKTAAADLSSSDNTARVGATSSDTTAVGISTGSASVTGRYDVVVSELAHAQVMQSQTSYGSLDDIVATSGAISLARLNDPPIEIPITGSMSLKGLADAINRASNSPVNASVVQVSPGQYRLVLTGRSTGHANAFTVSMPTALSGGAGLAFTDTNGDGTSGDSDADNIQPAGDAQFTVNQIAITSSSNVVSDVVPGVTLTLRKKGTDPVALDVSRDDSALTTQVQAFATAVNDLVSFINTQASSVTDGKTGIAGDPLVRSLRSALRSVVMGPQAGTGSFARLAEVGVAFDGTGKITIDQQRLTKALEQSSADVATLFTDRFAAIDALMSDYTRSGGLVSDVRKRIDTQVKSLGDRIDNMEAQLEGRRAALQQEFIAADRAMSQLNSQSSSLSQLGGQYRLF